MNEWRTLVSCILLTYTFQAATADTYYRCRDDLTATPNAQFTISCPDSGSIINVQSALLGVSDRYDVLFGTCPWTNKTSTTCQNVAPSATANCNSTFCGNIQCNCIRSTSEPPLRCNGLNRCSFPQNITRIPSQPFCVLSREANFIVVNYTCVQNPSAVTLGLSTVRRTTTSQNTTKQNFVTTQSTRSTSTTIRRISTNLVTVKSTADQRWVSTVSVNTGSTENCREQLLYVSAEYGSCLDEKSKLSSEKNVAKQAAIAVGVVAIVLLLIVIGLSVLVFRLWVRVGQSNKDKVVHAAKTVNGNIMGKNSSEPPDNAEPGYMHLNPQTRSEPHSNYASLKRFA